MPLNFGFMAPSAAPPGSPFASTFPGSTPATNIKRPTTTLPTPSSPAATSPTAPKAPVSPAKQQYISSVATAQPTAAAGGATLTPSAGGADASPFNSNYNMQIQGTGSQPVATGATSVAPPAATDPYKAAYGAYISSLMPSDTETSASKYLNDLILQSKRDYEDALTKGETMGFATGEAARVNKNNQFGIDAASNALDALTGSRSATQTANKARVDFEKSLLPSEQSISEKYGTGAIGEYNFAKENGYKGSFTDYQNEDANRKARATSSAAPKIFGSEASGYFTLNADGTATPIALKPSVSWEQYLKAAEGELGMNLNPDSDSYKKLKEQYASQYTKTAVGGGGNDWGL